MLFQGAVEKDVFWERYGGPRYGRIRFPGYKPYIYFVISEDNRSFGETDEFDIDDADNVIFGFRWNGRIDEKIRRVLRAVNPAEREQAKSIFLFRSHQNGISWIGEYEIREIPDVVRTRKNDRIVGNDNIAYEDRRFFGVDGHVNGYFFLHKVVDLDGIDVKLVTGQDEDGNYTYEYLPPRSALNFLYVAEQNDEIRIEPVIEPREGIEENCFLDRYNNIVDLDGQSNEAKKAIQYMNIVQGYHRELFHNTNAREEAVNHPVGEDTSVFFYVVNVGWGLCQLLAIEREEFIEIWVFDCGTSDVAANRPNLEDCLADISHNKEYRITKVFVSHPHEDHYNLFNTLAIENEAEIWINKRVRLNPPKYLRFLTHVRMAGYRMVPFLAGRYVENVINVLHPINPIVLTDSGTVRVMNGMHQPLALTYTNKANVICPVIELAIKNKSIIITGDIMENGWDQFMVSIGARRLKTDVYVHSHHGTRSAFRMNNGNNEFALFDIEKHEFASLQDGYRSWHMDADLTTHYHAYPAKCHRTDRPNDIVYFEYSFETDMVREIRR